METKDYHYMGCLVLRKFLHDNSWQVRQGDVCLSCLPSNIGVKKAKQMVREMICKNEIQLAPLPLATCTDWMYQDYADQSGCPEQAKGINPMYATKTNSTTTDVTINASTQPSDASKARDFLMSEFRDMTRYSWQDPRYTTMRELYNIDAPSIPKTSQEIIDAFKNGDVIIDQAKVDKQTKYFSDRDNFDDEDYEGDIGSRYFGVTFTKLPVPDPTGYNAAVKAFEDLKTATKRKLAILDPEAGLEVLTAFEAWQPTLATATAH